MAGLVALMVTACEKKRNNVSDLNGEWQVTEINGAPVQRSVKPWLGFNVAEKRVYGNVGANTVTGVLTTGREAGSIDLTRLGATKMMGTPEQMSVEDLLTRTLATVKTYEMRRDGKLELRNAAGKKVVILEKRNGTGNDGDMYRNGTNDGSYNNDGTGSNNNNYNTGNNYNNGNDRNGNNYNTGRDRRNDTYRNGVNDGPSPTATPTRTGNERRTDRR